MFLLIHGSDRYRARKTLDAMRERFLASRDPSGLNVARFDAKKDTLDAVLEAVFASPFLAEKKLVIIENLFAFSQEEQKKFETALAKKPEATNVIVYEPHESKDFADVALFALLAKQPYSAECRPMTAAQVSASVADHATSRGVAVARDALGHISAVCGDDIARAMLEASKLCDYVLANGHKQATLADATALLIAKEGEEIFAFLDAATEDRPREALIALRRLAKQPGAEFLLLYALVKQYRAIFGAADLVVRGVVDPAVLAKKLGIHPFVAKKILVTARRTTPQDARRRFGDLLEIERQCKTGAKSPLALLELFLLRAKTFTTELAS